MELLSVILLMLYAVCFTQGRDICEISHYRQCRYSKDGETLAFPKTAEEMVPKCSSLNSMMECLINYKYACPNTTTYTVRTVKKFQEAVETFCDSNSIWYKGVVKYGNCYQNVLNNLPKNFTAECFKKIRSFIDPAYLNFDGSDRYKQMCYYHIEMSSCIAEQISEECGEAARELGLHFIREAGPWDSICFNDDDDVTRLMQSLNFRYEPETTEEEFANLFQMEDTKS